MLSGLFLKKKPPRTMQAMSRSESRALKYLHSQFQ